jgi:hypothetical protein
MTEESAEPKRSPPARLSPGCLTASVVVVLTALIIAAVLGWKAIETLGGLPSKFLSQHITQTFREEYIKVTPTQGDILEVATLEMTETITSYDMKSAFGNLLYLGTTVSEVKVPTVYRYHLRLTDDWKLSVKDGVCTVLAPSIRPSQPPAIRTDGMERKSEAGWLRFNSKDHLEQLEKSLTPTLEKRAGTPHRINQVREGSRKAVAEFVRTWLLKEGQWKQDGISAIVVRFPDEEAATAPLPTLQLP